MKCLSNRDFSKTLNKKIRTTVEQLIKFIVIYYSSTYFVFEHVLIMCRFHSGSAPVPLWFHSGSAPVPHRFHSSSAPVPLRFHSGSVPVPLRFHSGFAPVLLWFRALYKTGFYLMGLYSPLELIDTR